MGNWESLRLPVTQIVYAGMNTCDHEHTLLSLKVYTNWESLRLPVTQIVYAGMNMCEHEHTLLSLKVYTVMLKSVHF